MNVACHDCGKDEMKIRCLYHNPKGERGVGKAIVAWTWVLAIFYSLKAWLYNFSHEEVWLPEVHYAKDGSILGYAWFAGRCFSSTTRGKWKGVRFAPASEVLKHPERWSYIEVEVDPAWLRVAIAWAEDAVGAGYDYGYILSFLQPFIVQKESDWACSEICDYFKRLCRIIPKYHKRISPRRSAYLLAKKWGEPKALI